VTVKLDGEAIHRWEVTPENVFALQTNLRLDGQMLTPGKHTFEIVREGEGKVYFSSFLSYFSKEDHLKASGNELHIDRKYYKLIEKVEEVDVTKRNADGTTSTHKEKRVSYDRELLEFGAQLTSGDKIEVELNLKADNDYEYLAFEDFKPAGCEPVALRSGRGYAGGLVQNVELRDDRVAFFVSYMPQGTARLKYQLRCEIPGTFSALPTQGGSMYVPEVRANSEEWKVSIQDRP
jgi:alpha-2-macroglobulin